MEVIQRKRGNGKTTELIRISYQTMNTIVCVNETEVRSVLNIAKNMGLKIPPPITFSKFLSNGKRGGRYNGFLIDNVDILLENISEYIPVKVITLRNNIIENDCSLQFNTLKTK